MFKFNKKIKVFISKLIVAIIIVVNLSPNQNLYAVITPETVLDAISLGADAGFCFRDPNLVDCGFMIYDVFAILVPAVPGSYAPKLHGKSIRYSDKAIKIKKGAKLSVDIADSVDDINKYNKVIIGPYKEAFNVFSRNGVEVHHLLEHRGGKLAKALGLAPNEMFSIPISKSFHRKITTRWRKALPYGLEYSDSVFDIIKYRKAVKEVYRDMPKLKSIALYQLYGSPAFINHLHTITRGKAVTSSVAAIFKKYGLNLNDSKNIYSFSDTPNSLYNNIFNQNTDQDFMKNYFMNEFVHSSAQYTMDTLLNKGRLKASFLFSPDNFIRDLSNELKDYVSREDLDKLINDYTISNDDMDSSASGVVEVTKEFADKKIFIKSIESNNYISVDSQYQTLHADGYKGEKKEEFKTHYTNDGWIGFKSSSTGKWISVKNSGYLKADANDLKSWECFKILKYQENYFLLSQKNASFVQVVMNEPAKPLAAKRELDKGLDGATWERFNLEHDKFMGNNIPIQKPNNNHQQEPTYQNDFNNGPNSSNNVYKEGRYVSGFVKNGKVDINSSYYFTGTWNDQTGTGYGKIEWVEGSDSYGWYGEGNIVNFKLDGDVVLYSPDGEIYNCHFKDGIRQSCELVSEKNDETYMFTTTLNASEKGYVDIEWNPDNYNEPYTVYKYIYTKENGEDVWEKIAISIYDGKYRDYIVENGKKYFYYVSEENTNFNSKVISVTIPYSVDTELSADIRGYVDIKWNIYDDQTPFTVYKHLGRNENDEDIWDPIASNVTTGFYRDSNVENGQTYYYYVKNNEAGYSGEMVNVKIPYSLDIELIYDKSGYIDINWNNNDRNEKYSVYKKVSGEDTWDQIGYSVIEGTFRDYNIIKNNTYYYYIENEEDHVKSDVIEKQVPFNKINLYIGKSQLNFNGDWYDIDNQDTSPVIINGRTLLPVRSIIETMGGEVQWDQDEKKITLDVMGKNIQMWIDHEFFYVDWDGEHGKMKFDVSPTIINSRTMIPARALFENLGCDVSWDKGVVTITY